MKKDVIVSMIIGYLATYHKIFTEPITVAERLCATVGIGVIVFFGILKMEGEETYGR